MTEHPCDSMRYVSGEDTADSVRSLLARLAPPRSGDTLLGLACGAGLAELALAKMLNINTVKLVDKYPINLTGHDDYINSDLFEFMENHPLTYSYITAFGIEYLLDDRACWNDFWKKIMHVTHPGSVIVVAGSPKTVINNNYFTPLTDNSMFLAQRNS